ncbi:hypothetical protein [Croceimicrobium sp.]|uniref:hypothetical protein n=1 Tax=Croceimicrobium sp. TaxID=2828340 RepID=UPI003BA911D2
MKDLVREKELQLAYDRIMARENLQIAGAPGMGKSYLLRALGQKLQGRRILLELNFTGVFQFEELVFRLHEGIEKTSAQHAGLEYQIKRLHQEHPPHRIRQAQDLLEYLKALTTMLFQAGQDVIISLEDPEYCEVQEIKPEELVKEFKKMSTAANIQLIILSEFPHLKTSEQIHLQKPEAQDIWTEATDNQRKLLDYSAGNLSFLKALIENMKQHQGNFEPEAFFKSHQNQFLMLRHRFTDLQWRLLRALASEEIVAQPHAFDFLVRHKLGAASSVERALRNLLDSAYILRDEQGYRIKDPLLHRWLQYLYYRKTF